MIESNIDNQRQPLIDFQEFNYIMTINADTYFIKFHKNVRLKA